MGGLSNQMGLIFSLGMEQDPSVQAVLSETQAQAQATLANLQLQAAAASTGVRESLKAMKEELSSGAAQPDVLTQLRAEAEANQVELNQLKASISETKAEIASFGETATVSLRGAGMQAQFLSRELGVAMPRAITTSIAQFGIMRDLIGVAFPVIGAVFLLEHLGKIVETVQNAASSFGGFGDAARKALKDTIKDSDDALVHFRGMTLEAKIASGEFLIAQTRAQQLSLEQQKTALEATSIWKNLGDILVGLGSQNAVLTAQGITNLKAYQVVNEDIAKLQERLNAQVKELGTLEVKENRKKTEAARKALADRYAMEEEAARFSREILQRDLADFEKYIREKKRLSDEIIRIQGEEERLFEHEAEVHARIQAKEVEGLEKKVLQDQKVWSSEDKLLTQIIAIEKAQRKKVATIRDEFEETRKEIIQKEQEAMVLAKVTGDWSLYQITVVQAQQAIAQASLNAKRAQQDELVGATAAVLGAIGLRREQAGIELIWETAQARSDFAKFFEHYNPSFLAAALQHTASAVEYGKIAFGGGSGPSGIGGGTGSGSQSFPSRNVLATGSAAGGGPSNTININGGVILGTLPQLTEQILNTAANGSSSGRWTVQLGKIVNQNVTQPSRLKG